MAFVGIDIGTSFIKGAVLDVDACTIRDAKRLPFPDQLPGLDPLFFEFSPHEILTAVAGCIHDLIKVAGVCDGIVMCNQMHSMVLMNENGDVHSNCIGWRDQRALQSQPSSNSSYYEDYTGRLTAAQRKALGNERPVGTPASFLYWFAKQGLLEAGTRGVSIGDFVLSKLCGAAPSIDPTNAMAFELLDLTSMSWHEEVIAELGLDVQNLPALAMQGDVIGYLDHKGRKIPCYAPVGDYQCALAGAMLNPSDLSINISTGSQVSRISTSLALGDYQTRPFFDGKFTSTVTHLPAGRALNILVDLLTELPRLSGDTVSDPWRWITAASAASGPTDLEARISFFPGPCGTRGSISGIGERNLTVGSLFRAAFENMAENYHACALQIWPEQTWGRIVLSGGLAHKIPLLHQIIADRFEKDTRLCEITEDTLSGLLMMALAFGGTVESMEQAKQEVEAARRRQT